MQLFQAQIFHGLLLDAHLVPLLDYSVLRVDIVHEAVVDLATCFLGCRQELSHGIIDLSPLVFGEE